MMPRTAHEDLCDVAQPMISVVMPSLSHGRSQVIGQIAPHELSSLRRDIWRHGLLRSRLLRIDPYTLALKIKERIFS